MTLVRACKSLGITRNIRIQNAAGGYITPGANDLVRAKIGRVGQTPVLTVTSGSPTAAGSSFTKGDPSVLRLDATDLSFDPGTYTLFIEYYDNADAQEWKCVDRQVFHLEDT